MKTNQPTSSIKKINVHIVRNSGEVAEKIYVYVTIWSLLSNTEIRDFDAKDLVNHNSDNDAAGVLNLNVNVVRKKDSVILEKPILIYKVFELKQSELGYRFNRKNDFIFLTNIHDLSDLLILEGTKRTVITYEDSDVIDETF